MQYKEIDFNLVESNGMTGANVIRQAFVSCGYANEDEIRKGVKLLDKLDEGGIMKLDEATETFLSQKLRAFLPKIEVMPRDVLITLSLLFDAIEKTEAKDL